MIGWYTILHSFRTHLNGFGEYWRDVFAENREFSRVMLLEALLPDNQQTTCISNKPKP